MANPAQIGQGGVVYDQAALIVALRNKVATSIAILTDPQALQHLEDARVEINRRKPLVTLQSFAASASKQRYSTVEAGFPANWTGGKPFVFWDGGSVDGGCGSVPLGPYDWSDSQEVLSALYSGATVDLWQIERVIALYNYFLRRFGARGWLTEGNEIWLAPQPTAAVTVYYMLPRERFAAITDIDIQYREAFFSWAVKGAAEYLAGMQGEIVKAEGPDGKDITTAGGVRWRQQADKAENRFERLMAPGPMLARSAPGPRFA